MEGSCAPEGYYFPAEWEPHESIWMSWPIDPSPVEGYSNRDAMANMIVALVPHVKVSLCINDEEQKQEVLRLVEAKGVLKEVFDQQLVWRLIPHQEHWMRDFGPIFLKSRDAGKPLQVAVFDWNCWGYTFHIKGYDEMVKKGEEAAVIGDGQVCPLGAGLLQLETFKTGFVSEGGDREYNGKGTLMVTEAVEFQRNPNMSKEELTERFIKTFNVKKVIWLKRGLADDYQVFDGKFVKNGLFNMLTTGGHVDEYARFVDERTILLADVLEEERDDPVGRASYENMEENYKILLNETDQDGQSFNIIRLPLPPTLYQEISPTSRTYEFYKDLEFKEEVHLDDKTPLKGIVPASYCNFLVTNGIVLLPRYHKEGLSELYKKTDDMAKEILQRSFPDRKIVQIDALTINFGGGGMHCITQQQPASS